MEHGPMFAVPTLEDLRGQRANRSTALCHLLHIEFPGVFGPAITKLFADKIDELYARFHPPASQFRVGQVLWAAVAVDDLPGRDKRIEDTRLVPVILDLVTAQDIHEATAAGTRRQTWRNKIVRLCTQAHAQGGVLSLADVAFMLHVSMTPISKEILEYERGRRHRPPSRHCPRHGPVGHPQGHHLFQAARGKKAHQPGRVGDVSQRR